MSERMGERMGEVAGSRRDDLDQLTRAVSDTLDELLYRHHGLSTSWSNPESFIKWLRERGYMVVETPSDCTCGHPKREHADGRACWAVVDNSEDYDCACLRYSPTPPTTEARP